MKRVGWANRRIGCRKGVGRALRAKVCLGVAVGMVLGGCVAKQTPEVGGEGVKTEVLAEAEQPVSRLGARPTTQAVGIPEPRVIEESDGTAQGVTGATTQPAGEGAIQGMGRKGTLIYTCRYARTEVLKEAVEGLISPEGSVQASPSLNTLIILDEVGTVRSVLKVLQEIDRPVAQLLVEARVVEVTLDSDLEYEIEHLLNIPAGNENSFFQSSALTLATPGAQPTVGQGAKINIRTWYDEGKYLQQFIKLLVTKGKARILSSPNLLVSAGNEASIITGEEVPIQSTQVVAGSLSTNTQFKRVGIKLRVNLQQITNDTAKLEINPEVSTVTGFTKAEGQGVSNPIIAVRNVSSTLAMKDGEILTVGGLLRDENRLIVRGVPLLMDVPGLGALFQSRRHQKIKTQLIFFMRIHILSEGAPFTTRVHQPGASMDRVEDKTGLVLPEASQPINRALPEGKGQKP